MSDNQMITNESVAEAIRGLNLLVPYLEGAYDSSYGQQKILLAQIRATIHNSLQLFNGGTDFKQASDLLSNDLSLFQFQGE